MHGAGTGMQLGQQQMLPAGAVYLGMPQAQPMQMQQQQLQFQQGPPQGTDVQPASKYTKLISRSVGCVLKVPKCHQADGVEQIDAKLDSTLTGKLDQEELAVVIWILTQIRPDMKLTDLRCEYYEELFLKFIYAANRIKDRITNLSKLFVPSLNHASNVFIWVFWLFVWHQPLSI